MWPNLNGLSVSMHDHLFCFIPLIIIIYSLCDVLILLVGVIQAQIQPIMVNPQVIQKPHL